MLPGLGILAILGMISATLWTMWSAWRLQGIQCFLLLSVWNVNFLASGMFLFHFPSVSYFHLCWQVTSVATSVYITESIHVDKETDPCDHARPFSTSMNSHNPIRPSFSALSFSVSRLSAESSCTDYLDSRLSPKTTRGPPCDSPDLESAHSEARENAMMRYKEKKKVRM